MNEDMATEKGNKNEPYQRSEKETIDFEVIKELFIEFTRPFGFNQKYEQIYNKNTDELSERIELVLKTMPLPKEEHLENSLYEKCDSFLDAYDSLENNEKPYVDKFIHRFLIELGYYGIASAGKKEREGTEYVNALKEIQEEYFQDKYSINFSKYRILMRYNNLKN